jgi:hypothetical protein
MQGGSQAPANLLVPEQTTLRVRLVKAVDTEHNKAGEPLVFVLAEDVTANGAVVIPRGATLTGKIEEARKGSKPALTLKLDSLALGSHVYKVYAYEFRKDGAGHGPTVTGTSKPGSSTTGNGWGTTPSGNAQSDSSTQQAGSSANNYSGGLSFGSGSPVSVPAQAQIDFYLASPLAVQPVSADAAVILARKVPPGAPAVVLQGERY